MTIDEYKMSVYPELLEKRLEQIEKDGQEKLDLGYGEGEDLNFIATEGNY